MDNEKSIRVLLDNKENKQFSKQEIKFRRLVQSIETKKLKLLDTEDKLNFINTELIAHILPLEKVYLHEKFEILTIFEAHYLSKQLKSSEKKILLQLINNLIVYLCTNNYEKKDLVIEIFEKLNQVSYQENQQKYFDDEVKETSEVFEDFDKENGVKNDNNFDNFEYDDFDYEKFSDKSAFKKKKTNKKTTKIDTSSQSIRKIYIELVKIFHPDTETEVEAQQEKTDKMQQITNAYQKNDLLELLKMQVDAKILPKNEVERINETQLKNYIDILQTQEQQLDNNLLNLEKKIPKFFHNFASIDKSNITLQINKQVKLLKKDIVELRKEKIDFYNLETLKQILPYL